jgi:hypothetical protein
MMDPVSQFLVELLLILPNCHEEYYFTDASADVIILVCLFLPKFHFRSLKQISMQFTNWMILQVEGTLYKIHKWQLVRASEVMRNMFSMPSEDQSEGTLDDNPIRLPSPNVSDTAFKTSLDFQYFGCASLVTNNLQNIKQKFGQHVQCAEPIDNNAHRSQKKPLGDAGRNRGV